MKWLTQMFALLQVPPSFTQDDVLNAENENDLREHSRALAQVESLCKEKVATDKKLRVVLLASQVRSNQYAELERRIKQATTRVRENF